MNTNDKTLADAQPGGRVRLGDQRSDLVPGIVRCAKCAFQLHRTNLYLQSGTVGAGDSKTEPCPNGCGPLWPVTWETWAREGWAEAERLHLENAALSAQPSPGGQDAPFTWSDRAKADALEAGQYAFTEADGKDLGYTACIEACVDAICLVLEMPEHRLALAARQPVGEPVAEVLSFRVGNDTSTVDKALPAGTKLYAAPPAQAVDLGPSQSVLAEVAQERARQEAKWGQQNHVDWTPTSAATDLAGAWPAGVGDHFKFITDYKAKGAEGHRLGYFDILMEEVAEAHDEARDGNTKATRAELVQVAAVAVAWIECIDRRLAVADSQAVGNG